MILKNRSFIVLLIVLLALALSCSDERQIDPGPTPTPGEGLAQVQVDAFGVIVDEPKINADFTITFDDQVAYEGLIGIEFRGASSQALFPKKSYGLETRDANNQDLDVSLLGLPEEEDWILYGPYSDKSLLRNVLIYDLARAMNHYASRTSFVELTVNNSYQGVYVFMEKLKRDKNRIDISKLNPDENSGEDLTGGYILKIDKTEGSNLGSGYNDLNSFRSAYSPNNAAQNQNIYFLYDYPDAEDITPEQKNYISTYVADFENALASDDFADPTVGYQAYIDTDSFIDFFILNELSNNVDGYRLSTFMHKDKNEKLKMGPIWDFNLAFGNAGYCSGADTDVWAYQFNQRCPGDFWLVPFWWERLLQDPNFTAKLKARWNTLRSGVLSETTIHSNIFGYIEELTNAEAINANFAKWNILGTYIWPNQFVGNSYGDEAGYLRDWISARLSWLDTQIGQLD